ATSTSAVDASRSSTRVSIVTPASPWRAASRSTICFACSPIPAVRMVSEAPDAWASSTARSTAMAAVVEPSVPTRIRLYIGQEATSASHPEADATEVACYLHLGRTAVQPQEQFLRPAASGDRPIALPHAMLAAVRCSERDLDAARLTGEEPAEHRHDAPQ